MVKALQISLDKSSVGDLPGRQAVTTWIKSFDTLLEYHNVSPVTWEAHEVESKLVFTAWIPHDCLPDFENVADEITEVYARFQGEDAGNH